MHYIAPTAVFGPTGHGLQRDHIQYMMHQCKSWHSVAEVCHAGLSWTVQVTQSGQRLTIMTLQTVLPVSKARCCGRAHLLTSSFALQAAGRRVAYHTFAHVLDLDVEFHLGRRTGALSRILERGEPGSTLPPGSLLPASLGAAVCA